MKLLKIDTSLPPHFVFQCDISECQIARDAGFRWHALYHQWWTSDPRLAAGLAQYASEELKAELLPHLTGLSLFELHQRFPRSPERVPETDLERMLDRRKQLADFKLGEHRF